MTDVTQILSEIEQGDSAAAERLLPLIYNELRKLAAQNWHTRSRGKRCRQRHSCTRRICDWWEGMASRLGTAAGISLGLQLRRCGES